MHESTVLNLAEEGKHTYIINLSVFRNVEAAAACEVCIDCENGEPRELHLRLGDLIIL